MYEYDDDRRRRRPSLGRTLAIASVWSPSLALGWFVVKPQLRQRRRERRQAIRARGVDRRRPAAAADDLGDAGRDRGGTTTRRATTADDGDHASSGRRRGPSTTTAAPTTRRRRRRRRSPPTTVAPPPPAAPVPYETAARRQPGAGRGPLRHRHRSRSTAAVPDQAAKDRLQALAVANAKPGQAATVANTLTINPAVPRSVGVRVVELTSARFPEGAPRCCPRTRAELDRVGQHHERAAQHHGARDRPRRPARRRARQLRDLRAAGRTPSRNYMAGPGHRPDPPVLAGGRRGRPADARTTTPRRWPSTGAPSSSSTACCSPE